MNLYPSMYFNFFHRTCTFLKKQSFYTCDFFRMSRMDVKTKLELSYVMESYWGMLPNEIKGYILQFKMSQEKID